MKKREKKQPLRRLPTNKSTMHYISEKVTEYIILSICYAFKCGTYSSFINHSLKLEKRKKGPIQMLNFILIHMRVKILL